MFTLCLFSVCHISSAQTAGLAQMHIIGVSVDQGELKVGDVMQVHVNVANQTPYRSSGFYVVLGITDSLDGYGDSLYSYATTAVPVIEGYTSVDIVIPVSVPNLKQGTKVKVQAQIFNVAGMPFGFNQSKGLFVSSGVTELSGVASKINVETITTQENDEKEFVVQNIGISTNDGVDRLIVDALFNGSLAKPSGDVGQMIRGRWVKIKESGENPLINSSNDSIPTADIFFEVVLLGEGKKEATLYSGTSSVTIGINSLEFDIEIEDPKPGAAIKVRAFREGVLLDEKVFNITNEKQRGNSYQFIWIGIALIVMAILYYIIRKFRNNRRTSRVGLSILLFAFTMSAHHVQAQGSSDVYTQTAQGTIGTFEIYAMNELFTLLSGTPGGVFAPGSSIPVTASIRGSTNNWGAESNTYAMTLKTDGVNTVKLGSCILPTGSSSDNEAWAESITSYMSPKTFRTFNNTVTSVVGAWSGPVSLGGTYWQTGSEDFTHDFTRCSYTVNTQITAPSIPGRYKMEIETIFGFPTLQSGNLYNMVGAYRRGQLYYYVKPAPPVVTISTSTIPATANTMECGDKINLAWGTIPGATSYRIYRSTNPATGFSVVGSVSSTSPAYVDSTGLAYTTYYYYVTAIYSTYSLESEPSNTVSAQKNMDSCTEDHCVNLSGVQAAPMFRAHSRDYFYSLDDGKLYFTASPASAGAACGVDMCADTSALEASIPAGLDWPASASTLYQKYSCVSNTQTCSCSGRDKVCVQGGVTTNYGPDSSCSLDAACSYGAPSGGTITFNYSATNIIGSLVNGGASPKTIPTTGNGVISETRTLSNTGDGQTDTATCSYSYTNETSNPAILSFTASKIVEKGALCQFGWETQDVVSCTLSGSNVDVSANQSFPTTLGRNITKTLTCLSNEIPATSVSATATCLVRPAVKEE